MEAGETQQHRVQWRRTIRWAPECSWNLSPGSKSDEGSPDSRAGGFGEAGRKTAKSKSIGGRQRKTRRERNRPPRGEELLQGNAHRRPGGNSSLVEGGAAADTPGGSECTDL